MKMKMRLLAVMVLTGISMNMSAQTEETAQDLFGAFRKEAQAEFGTFSEQATTAYEQFRDSVNGAYADFLEKAWAEYEMGPVVPKPKEREIRPVPKPKDDNARPIKDRPIAIDQIVPPVIPAPQPVPITPIRQQEMPAEERAVFTLYGTEMSVRFSAADRFAMGALSEKSVADAWRRLSTRQYDNLIRDCLTLRMKHNLSDWAYLKALERAGKACLGEGNEATLLMAYLYCQSGYRMRLGMNGGRLYMLYASDHALYEQGNYRLNGMRFYVLADEEPLRLTISEAEFPKEQSLSLWVTQEQHFTLDLSEPRTLRSENHTEVTCQMQVNKNLLAFYNDYPSSMVNDDFLTRWAMYANTPMQEDVKRQLYPMLKKHIEGKTELEAVGVILDFVQMAFPYGYDDKIWGYDRAFFAEETLFYPESDCEDHAILFSRLVRDLMGLKVVLVYYPRHLASAVQFTEPVKGDYLTVGGHRFTICDPTFFGAHVGQTMDDMDNQTAKAIILQ